MFCWTVANNLNSVRFGASLTQVAWTFTLRWRVLIGQYQVTWPYYTRKPHTRSNRDTRIPRISYCCVCSKRSPHKPLHSLNRTECSRIEFQTSFVNVYAIYWLYSSTNQPFHIAQLIINTSRMLGELFICLIKDSDVATDDWLNRVTCVWRDLYTAALSYANLPLSPD